MFINHAVGSRFLELIEDIAEHIGPVYLVTGTPVELQSPAWMLRSAPVYNRRNLFTRAWSGLLFLIAVIKEIWRVRSDVLLLVVSNPPMTLWLAWLANLIRRQPYIVLVYDIHPDLLVNLGWLSPNHPLTRLWRFLNRLAYQRAARIVTLGKYMAHNLEQYLLTEAVTERLCIIPTWVDTDRFVPLDKKENPFALRFEQQDKFTVLYSGNIGFSHDIRLLVDAAQQLSDQPDFHFLIIGHGPGKADLVEKVRATGLTNVTFPPFQPEEMLPYSLAVADVAVVSVAQGAEGLNMPSKTYYAMAVGAALLGLSQPPNDLADVIEQHGCGENVAFNDLEGLVAALRRFQTDRDYLLACRKAARDAAVQHFSRPVNTQRFVELFTSCLGSKHEQACI